MFNKKLVDFLKNPSYKSPFLVVDTSIIKKKYLQLTSLLSNKYKVYYAVKCNPAKKVISTLNTLDSYFDVASLEEIDICLNNNVSAKKLSWGSTIKKSHDIKIAYKKGINIFAFDSIEELQKIAKYAPSSKVYCRILIENNDAMWPLSKKFGCSLNMAKNLILEAYKLNLTPIGISFHVGSQQTNPHIWDYAIEQASVVFNSLYKDHNIKLTTLNVGGGFPAYGYMQKELPTIDTYIKIIKTAIEKYFINSPEHIWLEPGRYIVADAGIIKAQVILRSNKSNSNDNKWMYLDIGTFGGLIETLDESIKYKIIKQLSSIKNNIKNPQYYSIAGPTCDSVDVLYNNYPIYEDIYTEDYLYILSTGGYTTTYASQSFNGFTPLKEYYI